MTFEDWWAKAPLSIHLARPEDVARFAFEAGQRASQEAARVELAWALDCLEGGIDAEVTQPERFARARALAAPSLEEKPEVTCGRWNPSERLGPSTCDLPAGHEPTSGCGGGR